MYNPRKKSSKKSEKIIHSLLNKQLPESSKNSLRHLLLLQKLNSIKKSFGKRRRISRNRRKRN
jgi:hypothetical protein